MNKIILIGRLTKDVELKKTQSGVEFCNFSIAVQRPFKDKATGKYISDFFDCVVWRQGASILAKYCKKGDQVAVDGWMSRDSYADKSTGEKRYAYRVNVEKFDFGAKAGSHAADDNAAPDYGAGYSDNPDDEEFPF